MFLMGCGGSEPEPTGGPTGQIVVSTEAVDGHQDPDGYDVVVDGEPAGRIGIDEVRILDVAPGSHSVVLEDVEPGCSVTPSTEDPVTVAEDQTVEARFEVDCLYPIEDGIVVVAIASDLSNDAVPQLRVRHPDGAMELVYDDFEQGQGLADFALSPDGRQIAFATRDETPRFRLWLVDVDGSNARVIADDATDPTWAPDSSALAFERVAEEGPDIALIDLESGLESALPTSEGASDPAFSPDGTELAYVVRNLVKVPKVDFEDHIEILTLSGGAIRRITSSTETKSDPAWSPDGRSVIYSQQLYDPIEQSARRDLWIAATDETERPLTNGRFTEIQPFWSPDGDRIVWTQFTDTTSTGLATVSTDLEGLDLRLLWLDTVEDPYFFLPSSEAAGPTFRAEPSPALPAPTSRLVNGDADACSLEGWTADVTGTIDAVQTQEQGSTGPVVEPTQGDCFFSFAVGAPPGDDHALFQAGAVDGGSVLLLSGSFRTRDFEYATVTLSVDDGQQTLSEVSSGPIQSAGWEPFQLVLLAPEAAEGFELEIRAHLETGSFTNVYFDGLELAEQAVP